MAKYPSTLLAQVAGKTDSKDIEREIQKADLDLLQKINDVAGSGGTILSLKQTNYIERINDGYAMIDVECGASQRVVTLLPSSGIQLRSRTYAKNDSGAGELKLQCQGSDVIKYPGGTATAVYVGLQYQNTTLLAIPGGFLITDGVVQPVTGEPSQGTDHPHTYRFLNNSAVAIGTYTLQAITTGGCPAGIKKISGWGALKSASVGCSARIFNMAGTTHGGQGTQAADTYIYFSFDVPVDSSGQFKIDIANFDATGVFLEMNSYKI